MGVALCPNVAFQGRFERSVTSGLQRPPSTRAKPRLRRNIAGNPIRLVPADNPPTGCLAAGLGDHRALALGLAVFVKINDDPAGYPPKLVGPRGVRVERREMPRTADGGEQWEPCLTFRVEPLWRDLDQIAGSSSFAILAVDVE